MPPVRILLVSSFVSPHAGGVERFTDTVRDLLTERGHAVRLLACRRPGEDRAADALVPARFVGAGDWPLPTGGARTLWREVGWADAVLASNALQPLSDLAVLAARRRGVPRLLVVHGSGQPRSGEGRPLADRARSGFQRTLARAAVRRALVVSVSVAGLDGVRRAYGVRGAHLPYPLPELPVAYALRPPAAAEPLRVAWVGRLAPEKDPLLAVRAVERLRERRAATLDVHGAGRLEAELAALSATRPWLTLGGAQPWPAVLEHQARAHVCLSTSTWDNVQVAVLEALARGIPVVSTQVGDAERHHGPALRRFCVAPGDADAVAAALDELATGYAEHRRAFVANGRRLRALHGQGAIALEELIGVAGRPRRAR